MVWKCWYGSWKTSSTDLPTCTPGDAAVGGLIRNPPQVTIPLSLILYTLVGSSSRQTSLPLDLGVPVKYSRMTDCLVTTLPPVAAAWKERLPGHPETSLDGSETDTRYV